jgi:hypothetical protein
LNDFVTSLFLRPQNLLIAITSQHNHTLSHAFNVIYQVIASYSSVQLWNASIFTLSITSTPSRTMSLLAGSTLKKAHRLKLSSQTVNVPLCAWTNLSMQIIECTQQADHMRQSSEYNHEVENLMTATVYIMSPGIPPFRNLDWVKICNSKEVSNKPWWHKLPRL